MDEGAHWTHEVPLAVDHRLGRHGRRCRRGGPRSCLRGPRRGCRRASSGAHGVGRRPTPEGSRIPADADRDRSRGAVGPGAPESLALRPAGTESSEAVVVSAPSGSDRPSQPRELPPRSRRRVVPRVAQITGRGPTSGPVSGAGLGGSASPIPTDPTQPVSPSPEATLPSSPEPTPETSLPATPSPDPTPSPSDPTPSPSPSDRVPARNRHRVPARNRPTRVRVRARNRPTRVRARHRWIPARVRNPPARVRHPRTQLRAPIHRDRRTHGQPIGLGPRGGSGNGVSDSRPYARQHTALADALSRTALRPCGLWGSEAISPSCAGSSGSSAWPPRRGWPAACESPPGPTARRRTTACSRRRPARSPGPSGHGTTTGPWPGRR